MAIINLKWRAIRYFFLALIATALFAYYLYVSYRPPNDLYADLFNVETQASVDLPDLSKRTYVMFKQLQGAGFNNQAQEILLYHHLALQAGRTYVYQPLIWRPRGEQATVPLSAFLRGPTEGTISEAVFDKVCGTHIAHVNLVVGYPEQWQHALDVLRGSDRCIVVEDKIFNWGYLSSPSLHDLWPAFQQYIYDHFAWSDQVLQIVNRTQTELNLTSYMALHLRRGDFEDHCAYLASTQTGFTTWATLPSLASSVYPPALDTGNASTVLAHCYPSLRRVLAAVSAQARLRPDLRAIHIMHDGALDHPLVYLHVQKLAAALTHAGWAAEQGWAGGPMHRVTTSTDVGLRRGERDWAVCVDVELGRRAAVFVGNGFSSLSTQVVALRLGSKVGGVEDITFY
ncbi:hypothetical protein D9619_011725 [Psilocybe cf. subviscida]|uniref:Uncharacterized protein n=1 Tax=Psilocybe cf. subviscida TaxID=2480587 RepID=A0A8H5BSQ2_9AGAR|nr:hypothetical protein D9619_011725 [Psilocybe cf. subviscida]